ncbi:thioesterase domain-containing protein [Streptomyces sp. NBC_00564]|uniref:thioesterase domain-containing protein n=1 Tax=Streptomyces sp. NBC_00564 TaxID=2903663 RepID=UPI00352BD359|nr:thioesterase domain-containing protein [Streptomyces sp. NBC_00564]
MTGAEILETAAQAARLPCHVIERMVCEIWSDHFGHPVRLDDDFYDLGGDSLALLEVVVAAQERGIALRSSVAMRNTTPARLAESLTVAAPATPAPPAQPHPALLPPATEVPGMYAAAWTQADTRLAPVGAAGGAQALYVVYSDSHVQAERQALADWADGLPVRALTLPGHHGPIPPYGDVGAIADRYADAVRADQPGGPYRLAGFGQGAVVAFETARRLRAGGGRVQSLALIDPAPLGAAEGRPDLDRLLHERLTLLGRRFALQGDESPGAVLAGMREAGWYDDEVQPQDLPRLQLAWARLAHTLSSHEPADYDGPVLLVQDVLRLPAAEQTWRPAVRDLRVVGLDHHVASPLALLRDTAAATAVREAFTA